MNATIAEGYRAAKVCAVPPGRDAALEAANRDYEDLAREYEKLEARLRRKEAESVRVAVLQQRFDALKAAPKVGLDEALRLAILAALQGKPTPEQSLLVVQAVHPDRVVVMPKAFGSARVAERFKHPQKVFDLLMQLAGPYWEALAGGKGDTHARCVFGKESFSATESETTKGNPRAAELRTVVYGGEARVLWAHLKIGVKLASDAETLRVHFGWIAGERKILIGHCGAHLDLR